MKKLYRMRTNKYCDDCGKKFPPQHSTGDKDVDNLLASVSTCSDCLKKKLVKELEDYNKRRKGN